MVTAFASVSAVDDGSMPKPKDTGNTGKQPVPRISWPSLSRKNERSLLSAVAVAVAVAVVVVNDDPVEFVAEKKKKPKPDDSDLRRRRWCPRTRMETETHGRASTNNFEKSFFFYYGSTTGKN